MTRELKFGLAALLAASTALACSDDAGNERQGDNGEADSSDVSDAAAPDAADLDPDVPDQDDGADTQVPDVGETGDDGVEVDTPDADEPPRRQCTPPERLVGELCRSHFDRACLVDDDCRVNESCTWSERDTLNGTCIFTPSPPFVCPGAEVCEPTEGAPLRAAFGAQVVTPAGWELAREGFGDQPDEFGNPGRFTGDVSDPTTFCDCGRDMICPPEPEFDGCLSIGDWTGPDADGTEGDGIMQGGWLAGFGEGRNAALCPADWLAEDCTGANCCVSPFAHDDIWVRGGVFDQGETRIAVLSIDTIGYFYNDVERHFAALPAELGIDHVLMASTHTHNAPDTMGRWGPGFQGVALPTDSGIVPEWMSEIHAAVLELLEDAVARLEPVDLYATRLQTGHDGFAARDSRDPFIFADLVTALRVVRAGGDVSDPEQTLGVWVNWHNHPEAVGSSRFITSDFPHWLRLGLERGLDAGASEDFPAREALGGVAVYVSGAVGGLMTPLSIAVVGRDGVEYHESSFAKTQALGERLADRVAAAFGVPCPESDPFGSDCTARLVDPELSFATRELLLDVENVNFQAGAISLDLFKRPIFNWRFSDGSRPGDNLPKLKTALTQVRLGNFTFQTFPGEAFPETLTGFDLDRAQQFAIVGNPRDRNCASDRVTRLDDGVEPREACILTASNPAPPDLDRAPNDPGLYDTIPGDYLFVVGNGMDSIGYLIPTYDFVVHPDFGVLFGMPGHHYEEEVSIGDAMPELLSVVEELTEALGR